MTTMSLIRRRTSLAARPARANGADLGSLVTVVAGATRLALWAAHRDYRRVGLNVMLTQLGVQPNFAAAVAAN